MKFSLFLPTGFGHEFADHSDPVEAFETIAELARTADDVGFETVWAPDHFQPLPVSDDFVFESWTTLAALARDTRRVRIGQLVTGNGYRNPALQAKMASTLDVLSGGRFTFGIGAGWYEADYCAFGYEFVDGPERLRRLNEAVQIIRSMWTEPRTTFAGRYYTVTDAVNEPKGVQRPHIPMMIAGGGEKVTLKIVARYGDAANLMEPPESLKRKYEILRRHSDTVGRDYTEITRTATTFSLIADSDEAARAAVPPGLSAVFPGDVGEYGLVGTLDTVRDRVAAYEAAGVQELVIAFHDALNPKALPEFAAEFIQ
jgi:F420-dependent oxidoreductase-like protein